MLAARFDQDFFPELLFDSSGKASGLLSGLWRVVTLNIPIPRRDHVGF